MRQAHILAVGKLRDAALERACAEYFRRCRRTVAVTVKDVRTEATRPQVLKKGYMEDLERAVRKREAAEAAAAASATKASPPP